MKAFSARFTGCRFNRAVVLLLMFLVCRPPGGLAEAPLETYRRLVGSSLEARLLRFTRAAVLHQLDPETAPPQRLVELGDLPPTGLYLSLMKERVVRACIGSFTPYETNLEAAIKHLTAEVVHMDARTQPISLSEMETLSVVLSFVGPLREVEDPQRVDFTTEGVFMAQDKKGLVLLPGETRTLDFGLRKLMRQNRFDPKRPLRYAAFQVVAFDERRQ